MSQLPLVVDLDGTIIKTDILYETTNSFISQEPLKIFSLLKWLLNGKSHLKTRLSKTTSIDVSTLPYNEELIAWLEKEKKTGREIILATASHRTFADEIAEYLGLFDKVLATDNITNLRGKYKKDVLVELYGEKKFEYVGDCKADIPVWASAKKSHLVGNSTKLINTIKRCSTLGEIFQGKPRSQLKTFIKAIRLHQWVKNLLVFVPILAAHTFTQTEVFLTGIVAFFTFGITASSVYLLNDLIDVQDDRHHKTKKNRPFASGNLSLLHGWVMWPILLLLSSSLSVLLLPIEFSITLLAYYILTLAYSFTLKRKVIVDVIALATLYTIRILAGAAATATLPSFWLLAFSMFIFLSLAFIKRFSELKSARDNGKEKLRGRGYLQEDLEAVSAMGTASGYISVLVLALYIQDSNTVDMYTNPQYIWFACPILMYWISRAWLITHRGKMTDDPIVFAIKDKVSWVVGTLVFLAFSLAGISI